MRLKTRSGGTQPLAILPPKSDDHDKTAFNIRIPRRLAVDLDKVADETGYSRNEVITRFLEFALEQHRTESSKKR